MERKAVRLRAREPILLVGQRQRHEECVRTPRHVSPAALDHESACHMRHVAQGLHVVTRQAADLDVCGLEARGADSDPIAKYPRLAHTRRAKRYAEPQPRSRIQLSGRRPPHDRPLNGRLWHGDGPRGGGVAGISHLAIAADRRSPLQGPPVCRDSR